MFRVLGFFLHLLILNIIFYVNYSQFVVHPVDLEVIPETGKKAELRI